MARWIEIGVNFMELERRIKWLEDQMANINGPHSQVIKVNLPETLEGYHAGNGEGIWAYIIDEQDVTTWDEGEGKYYVALLNDSFYHPQLKWGTVILAEGRGDNRPVMNREWAEENGIVMV